MLRFYFEALTHQCKYNKDVDIELNKYLHNIRNVYKNECSLFLLVDDIDDDGNYTFVSIWNANKWYGWLSSGLIYKTNDLSCLFTSILLASNTLKEFYKVKNNEELINFFKKEKDITILYHWNNCRPSIKTMLKIKKMFNINIKELEIEY